MKEVDIQELKNKADTLEEISFNVIVNNNIIKTWNDNDWNIYKEEMKKQIKKHNIQLTREIIQQIKSETDDFKIAMYKILTEVDGIQDQFKNVDLKQGQKLTLFYISDWGEIAKKRITFDSVENTSYAQYNNAIKLTFKPECKRKLYYQYFYSTLLVYDGWVELPETVLYTIENNEVFTSKKSKYLSCDDKQYDAILEYFENKKGIKPIINTYKPQF